MSVFTGICRWVAFVAVDPVEELVVDSGATGVRIWNAQSRRRGHLRCVARGSRPLRPNPTFPIANDLTLFFGVVSRTEGHGPTARVPMT